MVVAMDSEAPFCESEYSWEDSKSDNPVGTTFYYWNSLVVKL